MEKIMILSYEEGDSPFTDSGLAERKHLIVLDGSVKIAHGLKGYIMETLEEAPLEMEFILIERKRRVTKEIEKTTKTPSGRIHIYYTDGTDVIMDDFRKNKNES